MKLVVVDASVAAKWVLPAATEPLKAEADTLLAALLESRCLGLVPELFWVELAQVLAKAVTQRRLAPGAAPEALALVQGFGLQTALILPVLPDALALALVYRHPVYDCLYVALAHSTGSELVTADEQLVRRLGSRLPIRWLGAL